MPFPSARFRFHLQLYAAWLSRRPRFPEIAKECFSGGETFPSRLDIFYWTPVATAGAQVIVHDVLPSLVRQVRQLGLDWTIEAGPRLPDRAVDWLVCFKAVPDATRIRGRPSKVLLICDQGDVFWDNLPAFEGVVATSSPRFATVLARKHPRVAFISESEPVEYLEFGRRNLSQRPAARGKVLLWHGGAYSMDALEDLRPALQRLRKKQDLELHVVSGGKEPRTETWEMLNVHFFPWSKEQLLRSAAVARLGFVPARRSLKNSWLKPASRVRCLYALGVPTIGDDRVPDVVDFASRFDGPLAGRGRTWEKGLLDLWTNDDGLARFAGEGHAAVAGAYSTEHTARQWLRYFSTSFQ